jgi:hypothetical protein
MARSRDANTANASGNANRRAGSAASAVRSGIRLVGVSALLRNACERRTSGTARYVHTPPDSPHAAPDSTTRTAWPALQQILRQVVVARKQISRAEQLRATIRYERHEVFRIRTHAVSLARLASFLTDKTPRHNCKEHHWTALFDGFAVHIALPSTTVTGSPRRMTHSQCASVLVQISNLKKWSRIGAVPARRQRCLSGSWV